MNDGARRAGVLSVSADLRLQVTAPDGTVADIALDDRDGELVLDVRGPLTAVVRSLPPGTLTALPRHPVLATLPPLRVRARGVTLAVLRAGRPQPGAAVVGLAALVVAAAVGVTVAVGSAARTVAARHRG